MLYVVVIAAAVAVAAAAAAAAAVVVCCIIPFFYFRIIPPDGVAFYHTYRLTFSHLLTHSLLPFSSLSFRHLPRRPNKKSCFIKTNLSYY